MATRVTRVGSLDIQFQQTWDSVKGNQLVQSLQQTISAVNSAWVAIAALQESGGGGGGNVTAPVQIADGSGKGPQVAFGPGLSPGEVLIAISGENAAFGQLQFGEMAQTDQASFEAPAEGDVIMFHTGFWTAMPDPNTGLGLGDPGQNAIVMWNEGPPGAFAWAIPGNGIKLTPGSIAVDETKLDHAKLEGLHFTVASGGTVVANDHPQYAMLAGANVWTAVQTFAAGLISNADITLNGNLEQAGAEPEWRITNTDDAPNEGAWRIHAEPGQFIISSVSDDGADGENWLCATRIGETVDAVNISSNSFTWNGAQVLTTEYVPPLQSNPTFISPITVPQGITLTGVEPFFTMGDTQSAPNEGYWQLHVEPGMLIWSTLYDDGISWGENWLTVTRSDELVDSASIDLQGGALRFNGDDVLTASSLAAGANTFFTTNSAGQLVLNAATGSGGGGTPAAPSTSVQFNNGGAFGGSANFTWGGTGVVIKSDITALQIQSLTTAGYSYINMANQAGTRELEFLFIGSAAAPVYGGAVGDSVINVNSGNLWLSTGDLGRVSISHTGNVVVAAPTSGTAAVINGVSGANALIVNAVVGAMAVYNSTNASGGYITWQTSSTSIGDVGAALANLGFGTNADMSISARGANSLYLATNTTNRVQINGAGNVIVATPGSGVAVQISAFGGSYGAISIVPPAAYSSSGSAGFMSSTSNTAGAFVTTGARMPGIDQCEIGVDHDAGHCFLSAFGVITLRSGGAAAANERVVINAAGNIFMNAPSSSNTLAIATVAGANAITLNASGGGTGGILNDALTAPTIAMNSSGADFGLIGDSGTQVWYLGAGVSPTTNPTNKVLTWSAAGQVIVTGPGASNIFEVTDGTGTFATQFSGGAGTVFAGTLTSNTFALMAGNRTAMTVLAAGNITTIAPASGTSFTVSGTGSANALVVASVNSASNSFGISIGAGTNSADYLINAASAAGTQMWKVDGAGSWQLANSGGTFATGGAQGAGTINAIGLFVQGVAVGLGNVIGVSFNGTSTPSIINHVRTGTTSVSRSSAGHYTVSWAPGFNPSICVASLTTPTAAGVVLIDAFSSTVVQITTSNLAGTAVDLNSTIQILALQ